MDQDIALFRAYPALKKNLPYVALAQLPTPIDRLPEDLAPGFGENQAFIKRDDVSGEYGGNKVRKLEFLLGDAKVKGAKTTLTYGADGSNHAVATAVYAKRLGMKSISLLFDQPNAAYVRHNLLKSLAYGVEIHHYPTLQEQQEAGPVQKKLHLEQDGVEPYEVPVGGSCALGDVGFVNAAFELYEQVQGGRMPEPDYIYVPSGTMGTGIGLTIGIKALGMKTKVVSVRVNNATRVNDEAMLEQIEACYQCIKQADPSFPDLKFTLEDVCIDSNYFGEAYAKFTPEGYNAIQTLHRHTGILLDGTYSGKAFAAFLHDMEKVHKGKVCLFWNTLNSKDFRAVEQQMDYHNLPETLHKYFETPVQEFDVDD